MNTVPIEQAINIALSHHNAGRLSEASSIYEQILLVQPENASVLFLLGRLRNSLGKHDEAVALLQKAAAHNPNTDGVFLHLGDALKASGRFQEALASYQQAVFRNPDNMQAVTRLIAALQRHAVREFPSPHGPIRFACIDELPLYRAQTLLTKEPETLEWIDGFEPGDVFWDVGANIGVYTLYAAAAGKVGAILSFEPSSSNYMLLNRNIEQNSFSSLAKAYCVAFNDTDMVSDLHMQSTDIGGALSSFDSPVDHNGQTFSASFRQGMVGFSIDSFVSRFNPPFPNRLKIDVDGIEDKIINGASATLADPRLRSLSIELDDDRPDYRDAVAARIEVGGLMFVSKRHASMFDGSAYKNIYNFHFTRR